MPNNDINHVPNDKNNDTVDDILVRSEILDYLDEMKDNIANIRDCIIIRTDSTNKINMDFFGFCGDIEIIGTIETAKIMLVKHYLMRGQEDG